MGKLQVLLQLCLMIGIVGGQELNFRKWNLEEVIDLTTEWGVPSQFEIVLYADPLTRQRPLIQNGRAMATMSLKGLQDSVLRDLYRRNRFLIIFHHLTNTMELKETFDEIIIELHAHQRAGRGNSGTRHHFILWPNNASMTQEVICNHVEPYLGSIPLQSSIYILTQSNFLLELFSIKNKMFCQGPVTPSEDEHSRFQGITTRLPRRQDFQGIPIISTAVLEDSTEFEVRFDEDKNGIVSASGFAVNIFKDLEYVLNFQAVYIRGSWVNRNNVTGLPEGDTVSQLHNGSADIFITQTTLAKYRAIGMTYIQPTFQDSVYSFVQEPPSSSVHDVHISPFQSDLWIVVFCIWTLLALTFFVITCIRVSKTPPTFRAPPFSKLNQLQESFLWAISAGCNMGWYTFPKCGCSRLVIMTGSLTGALVFIMYSGSIISSLTSESAPIQSFQDLLNSSLEIYVDNTSSTLKGLVEYFRRNLTNNRDFKITGENISMDRVMERPAAVLGFARNIYRTADNLQITNQRLCDKLSRFPVLKLPLLNGMLLPSFSPFRETFNYHIMEIKERGLIDRYIMHFTWDAIPSCAQKKVVYRDNLGIQDVFTAFALLGIGLALALVIFVLERWKYKKRRL